MKKKLKILPTPDTEYFNNIVKKLNENDGYCPCRITKNEDTKCMCKEFREQIKNQTPGFCHCHMYLLKEEEKNEI